MTPKQLMELEGFNPDIKWIAKNKSGRNCGFSDEPEAFVDGDDEGMWVAEGFIADIPFTLDWPTDDWTKCIYEREKPMIGMWGFYSDVQENIQIGKLTGNDLVFDVNDRFYGYFKSLNAEDLRMIKKANGIEETI